MDRAIIDKVAQAGFQVWMRKESDTWLYFTDGTRIGYLQQPTRFEPWTISTVHVPNRTTGTGFKLDTNGELTKETLENAFVAFPSWADSRDRESVRKWRDWEHFRQSSSFNREYQRVA